MMEKKILINSFTSILGKYGFIKQRGNRWVYYGNEILEIIFLQKSSFSDLYYFIFGFNVKAIESNSLKMHGIFDIFTLSNISKDVWNRLQDMCNLDYEIDDSERINLLEKYLNELLINIHGQIDTEEKAIEHLLITKQPLTKEIINYFQINQTT